MKRININGRRALTIVSILCACVLVGGCCWNPQHKSMGGKRQSETFEREKAALKSLAHACGIPESKINTMSPLALISELKIKMGNSEGYYGRTLSEADMNYIKDLLLPWQYHALYKYHVVLNVLQSLLQHAKNP